MTTIFALSSGSPPAAIAIIRVSGPDASTALASLAGGLPLPRRATRATLRGSDGNPLDVALVLWFPGPGTATGEDLAEFHVHGGRAVVAAVEVALAAMPRLRHAEPGEFTRRAFINGRIDLAEAEGLADLLFAETEAQRVAAITMAGGALSRMVEGWRDLVLVLSAEVEAALDFDEDDLLAELSPDLRDALAGLCREITAALAAPSAEALREGFRVALAGPVNAGKSTLFNALVDDDAAITSSLGGTTRDVLQRSVAVQGVPFTFIDMAGLRTDTADPIEALGIARAHAQIGIADVVLWLGPEGKGPAGAWEIDAQSDRQDRVAKVDPRATVSALTGENIVSLLELLVREARCLMPGPGQVAINRRQRSNLGIAVRALQDLHQECDILLVADGLRHCRAGFDALLGQTSTEDVLDTLFGRFCIGK